MAIFETLPYTNFHELNLDWIIKTIKELLAEREEWLQWYEKSQEDMEALKNWITQQFEANLKNTVKQALQEMEASGELASLIADALQASKIIVGSNDYTPTIDYYRYSNSDIWVWHGPYEEFRFTYNEPSCPPSKMPGASDFDAVANAGLPGYVMRDGQVLNPDQASFRLWGYLFIDENYNFHTQEGQLSTGALEDSGYMDACGCWPPIVEDGVIYDYTSFSEWDTYDTLIDVNPRTMIGKRGNELYIIYVAGRLYESEGLTYEQCGTFAHDILGLTECYQLDGGGSSMLCVGDQAVGITSELNTDNGRSIISCVTVKVV